MQSFMAETLYIFQVRARTSVGTGPWSIPVAVNTLPPGSLTDIICMNTEDDTFVIVSFLLLYIIYYPVLKYSSRKS